MPYYVLKVLVSALLIVAISEISKRSIFLGALVASLPLISILAFFWLYLDTKDIQKISALSINIFWLVIPSLILFLTLPKFLELQLGFYLSLSLSMALTALSYFIMLKILSSFGVNLS